MRVLQVAREIIPFRNPASGCLAAILSAGLGVLLCLLPAAVSPAELFRWEDDKGRVHYGNELPKEFEGKARPVRPAPEVTPEQRRAAEAVAERERAALAAREAELAAQKKGVKPAPQKPAAVQKPATASAVATAACTADWRDFRASEACFARFKLVGGGIKTEAFQICKQLPRPACNEPPVSPSANQFPPPEPSNRSSNSPHY